MSKFPAFIGLRVEGRGGNVMHAIVLAPATPRGYGELHDVMTHGMPKQATHMATKASMTASAVVSLSRTASDHLVDLSIIVRRCVWPACDGRSGPTTSTCTWLNLAAGMAIVVGCLVTLALLQAAHSLHKATTSAARPGHTKLAAPAATWPAIQRGRAHGCAQTLSSSGRLAPGVGGP